MNNLFIISENFTNGYKSEVLDIISVLVILSGIFVIISKNPVISLLFLIGLFGGIASYLLIVGLSFLGISYLVVYIGAVENRIIRLLSSNGAAWVKISLYMVILIINKNLFLLCETWNKFGGLQYTAKRPDSKYITVNLIPSHKLNSLCTRSNKTFFSTLSINTTSFYQWFVGFSDAESNFNIVIYKDSTGHITSVTFRFIIELHIDDLDALYYIKDQLNIGNKIATYGNSCKFTVTHPNDIYKLIEIFDKYSLNTTKYLDYLDFKKAFILYRERDKTIDNKEALISQILEIKSGMNSNRTNFNYPTEHKIAISDYWLLGLIEGDGSFYLDRKEMEPIISIARRRSRRESQSSLLENIKIYLENNLGFDKYSKFKLDNSSVISILEGKAKNNSKALSVLRVKNVNILNNYLIPYLDKMQFITKKGKDFEDFKLICQVIYKGAYRVDEIKSLILNLSYTMNNYRLSTNLESEKVNNFSNEDREKLINAKFTIKHLKDGRQLDIITSKSINRRWTNCVFEIIKENGDILLASTLKDAAEILSLDFRTVKRYLESESLNGEYVLISSCKVRRVAVF